MNSNLITQQCQGCRLVTFWQVSNCNILVFQHHSMKTDKAYRSRQGNPNRLKQVSWGRSWPSSHGANNFHFTIFKNIKMKGTGNASATARPDTVGYLTKLNLLMKKVACNVWIPGWHIYSVCQSHAHSWPASPVGRPFSLPNNNEDKKMLPDTDFVPVCGCFWSRRCRSGG